MSPYLKLWCHRVARFLLGAAAVYASTNAWAPSWSMPWFAILFSLPFAFVGWKVAVALLVVVLGAHAIQFADLPFSTEAAPFLCYLLVLPASLAIAWFAAGREIIIRTPAEGSFHLAIEDVAGASKLQVTSSSSLLSLGTSAPSLFPLGSLRLEHSPLLREVSTEMPGHLTQTGVYLPPYTKTEMVDTGMRSVVITSDSRVPLPNIQLLDNASVLQLPSADSQSSSVTTVLNVTVGMLGYHLIKRWWRASRKQLEGVSYEAATAKIERSINANVKALKKKARINGDSEFRVDLLGNVTFYVEMNRKGELFFFSPLAEKRLSGKAAVSFALSLADLSSLSTEAPQIAGLNILSFDSPVVRMAQYVDQAISR